MPPPLVPAGLLQQLPPGVSLKLLQGQGLAINAQQLQLEASGQQGAVLNGELLGTRL
jgi:hypothetical protein